MTTQRSDVALVSFPNSDRRTATRRAVSREAESAFGIRGLPQEEIVFSRNVGTK